MEPKVSVRVKCADDGARLRTCIKSPRRTAVVAAENFMPPRLAVSTATLDFTDDMVAQTFFDFLAFMTFDLIAFMTMLTAGVARLSQN